MGPVLIPRLRLYRIKRHTCRQMCERSLMHDGRAKVKNDANMIEYEKKIRVRSRHNEGFAVYAAKGDKTMV